MKKTNIYPLIAATLLGIASLASCADDDGKSREEKAGQRAVAFAQAYYNQHFDKASAMVTAESRKWITFFVSNMTVGDLDMLSQYPEASVAEVQEVRLTSDSTAEADVVVDHAFVADSLGKPGRMVDDKELSLKLVVRDKNWQVVLDSCL